MEFRALILLALLLTPGARAEDDGLVVSGEAVKASLPADLEQPADERGGEEAAGEWVPPPGYDRPTKIAPPNRFTFEEKKLARAYLNSLCDAEPVAADESRRVRLDGARVEVTTALNKQGSLRLLLENYVDSFRTVGDCVKRRATTPSACKEPGTLRHLQGSHAAWKTWSASPRGSDFLVPQRAEREKMLKAMQAEFYPLSDLSRLDSKYDSLARAEKMLKVLSEESTCRTRGIQVH